MSVAMPLEIVPVIDLKGGAVVRAKAGDRAHYQPIVTPLAIGARSARRRLVP